MGLDTKEYANGTKLTVRMPFATYIRGVALCSDGKVRSLKRISMCADTFFSVHASVTVKGKTVSGYITTETMEGYETVTENDPAVVKFIAYQYGKNGDMLPRGAYKKESES